MTIYIMFGIVFVVRLSLTARLLAALSLVAGTVAAYGAHWTTYC
jgi:hypothetical protein